MNEIALWVLAGAIALAALTHAFNVACYWTVNWWRVRQARAAPKAVPTPYPPTPQVWAQRPTEWRQPR